MANRRVRVTAARTSDVGFEIEDISWHRGKQPRYESSSEEAIGVDEGAVGGEKEGCVRQG